jgi:hypothetical protein
MRGPLAAGLLAVLVLSGCAPGSRSVSTATCVSSVAPQALEPITPGLGAPSGALVTADDRLWIADAKSGTVGRLNPDGSMTIWAQGLHNPGSMVELDDGSVLVAERDSGAIIHIIPGLGLFLFRAADPRLPGITGMVNAPGDSVFAAIPGQLIRVSRGREEIILHGLSDKPKLALEPSGGLLISDRNIGLQRLDRAGVLGIIAGVPPIRSIAVDHHGWLVFVSDTGELWRRMGGTEHRLLSGVPADATIAVDQADNILVADPHRNRVLRLVTSFVIHPARRVRAAFGKAVTLCIPVERASAYREPISMTVAEAPPGISAQVRRQPAGTEGATLSLLSDLPKRLKQGAIVLEVQSGTLKQRFFVTLDFGG